jgi:iron complex outermembrane receptor protein
VNRLDVTAGLDTQSSRHRGRSASGRDAYRQEPWSTDANFSNDGAFAEATLHVQDRQRVVFGARADRAEVTDERQQTSGMMPMPNPTAGVTRRETLSSGFARYERDLRDIPVSLYAGVGRAERMPDYWELFSPDMGPMGSVNAFSVIGPEKTTQLDVGLQYRTPRLDAWVSGYAGRVNDFILFTYTSGGMMGPMSSVSQVDANIRGGEAGVELRLLPQWKLGATLAYSWGENRNIGGALPQIPPLDARFTVAYDSARWSVGALLRAVDSQRRFALDQGNVVGRDLGATAGFAVLSLNATYRISRDLNIAAGVDNILDRTYTENLNLSGSADFGYPADPVRINEPGRTAWLKVTLGMAGR